MEGYSIKNYLIVIFVCFICIGCGNKRDVDRFKAEYEKYNDQYVALDLDDTSIVRYSDVDEVNKIIDSGSGVLFFGSPSDNLSRKVIEILLEVADSTDLENIYYLNSLDGVVGIDDVDKKIPLVLFVLDGKIVSYKSGTIDDKVELSDDEVIELYNFYSEGVHKVLQDACDEEC